MCWVAALVTTMPWASPKRRKLHAKMMAHKRWSNSGQTERNKQAQKMQEGKMAKWAKQIDPDGTMDPAELDKQLGNRLAQEMAKLTLSRKPKGPDHAA